MKENSSTPIVLLSELNFHYDLINSGNEIILSQVNETLRVDLVKFLKGKGKKSARGLISRKDYSDWIIKIHNKGFDFPVVFKNDLPD